MSGYLKIEAQVGFIVIKAKSEFFINKNIEEPKFTYTYDALYRLKTATGRELASLQMPTHTDFPNNIPVPNTASNAIQTYNQEFTYDELGNITEMKSVGNWTRDYYYDFANNRNYLLGHSSGTTTYTYDKHGNMLSMPHLTSMVWDSKDQLKEVTLNASGDKAYYVYDALGERVRKVIEKTGGIVEDRKYLGGFEIYKKTVSGSVDTERETIHISDDQKKILSVDTLTDGLGADLLISNYRYQYDNHLGSACLELDENAAIISYEEYHPFGTTSYRSGRTETEVSRKRYKYVGKERDEETGLYYYGARYYAAWIARFVSVDPLQHKYPHYTPFQYAGNKPITHIDIDGMQGTGDKPINKSYNYQYNEDLFSQYNSELLGEDPLLGAKITNEIINSAVDGFGNIVLSLLEYLSPDLVEGGMIRSLLSKQGVFVPDHITNDELGNTFKIRKEDRKIKIEGEESIPSEALDLGISALDVAVIMSPSKSTAILAKEGGIIIKSVKPVANMIEFLLKRDFGQSLAKISDKQIFHIKDKKYLK